MAGTQPGLGRLLLAILEQLFAEGKFRLFDLGGHTADYKAFHATGGVDYLRVIWFPITPKNLIRVTAHYFVCQAWRGAFWVKQFGAPWGARLSASTPHHGCLRSAPAPGS